MGHMGLRLQHAVFGRCTMLEARYASVDVPVSNTGAQNAEASVWTNIRK
jgi:hypothetical protein